MIDFTGLIEASVISPTLMIAIVAGVLGIKDLTFPDLPMFSGLASTPFFIAAVLGVFELWYSVIFLILGYISLVVFLSVISSVVGKEIKIRSRGITLKP